MSEELTLVDVSLSRAKGTPHQETVAKIVKLRTTAEESTPGGRRAKMIRNQTISQCDAALRQFCYSGVPAAGAASANGLDLSKVVL